MNINMNRKILNSLPIWKYKSPQSRLLNLKRVNQRDYTVETGKASIRISKLNLTERMGKGIK